MAAGMKGKLTITVHKGRNLKDTNFVSKLDPYVQLWTDGEKFKTKTHENAGKNPTWEQSFIFNLEGKEDVVHLHCYDKETLSDDSIGRADLSLKNGIKYNVQEWYQLVDKDNFSKKTGELLLTFTFTGTGGPATPAATPAASSTPAAAPTPTPAPQPVVQQPTVVQQPQPVQSFGQPAPQYGAPQYGAPQYPAGYPPAGYPGQPMGYPGQPMMGAPMMVPQQPQVVYVQQPQQPQVVYVPAPVAAPQVVHSAPVSAAPVSSGGGFLPLAGQSSGTQNVWIHVAGRNNLRTMDDGSVNAGGMKGPLAQWTAIKHADGTMQFLRDKHWFRIYQGTDAKGMEKGPMTKITVVPHGSGYVLKGAKGSYMGFDGSGNATEVQDINQAGVVTFSAR